MVKMVEFQEQLLSSNKIDYQWNTINNIVILTKLKRHLARCTVCFIFYKDKNLLLVIN